MPFSAHFYVLLTQFILPLYFAVSLIINMLLSIYLVLVSTNFTCELWLSHLFAGLTPGLFTPWLIRPPPSPR